MYLQISKIILLGLVQTIYKKKKTMYAILETISMVSYFKAVMSAVGWSMVVLTLTSCIYYLFTLEELEKEEK